MKEKKNEKTEKHPSMKTEKSRILIVDTNPSTAHILEQSHLFTIDIAKSAEECLLKLRSFRPDLVLLDLFLPGHHGIELLKLIKQSPDGESVGVIITSNYTLIQSYHASIKWGADYYIEKPFTAPALLMIIDCFFNKTLFIDPFPEHLITPTQPKYSHEPESEEPKSYLKFCGTRGSNPVAGSDYINFGGNTSCFEVKNGKDRIIIDAGTGIRVLGDSLRNYAQQRYDILFSHTHWDHLLGFPFFKPIYSPEAEVHLIAPLGFDKSTEEVFTNMLGYDYFPVSLDDLQSKIIFEDIRDSQKLTFGSIDVYTHYAFHPGSTLCFRIHVGDKKIGYITDNEFLMGYFGHPNEIHEQRNLLQPYQSMIDFFTGCDLMIHEAQYTPNEYKTKVGWGHSSIWNAAIFMKEANLTDWIVTHHDPDHTDIILLQNTQLYHTIMEEIDHPCKVRLAYDGMTLTLHEE